MVGMRLLGAVIVVVLTGAVLYASTNDLFFVYGAQISGIEHVDWQTVYDASGVHEQNIFWVQPARAAKQIEAVHGIKAARVHCDLPAKIVIEVEERRPIMMWRSKSQQKDWWLDEDGVVLPYHGIVTDTIFVVDSSEQSLEVGKQVKPDDIVQSVQRLAAALPEVDVFYYHGDRGLRFNQRTAKDEWQVFIGDSTDLARKIQVVQALTKDLEKRRIRPRYIDIRWADHPVYGSPGGRGRQVGD
jgi:hypothetical protein